MFAILETGGKQYKVQEGDVIEVELINKNMITKQNGVTFNTVLLIKNKDLIIGQPYVKDGIIKAKLLEEFKAPKIIVFKKKAKKGYKRKRGHRQNLHRIMIEKIELKPKKVEKKVKAKTSEKKEEKE
jgi:large subunit ribosomal protein L21